MRAWCARLGRLAPAIAKRPSLLSGQEGQALIEYALIISLIALVAIVALRTVGNNISGLLHTIAGEV